MPDDNTKLSDITWGEFKKLVAATKKVTAKKKPPVAKTKPKVAGKPAAKKLVKKTVKK